MQVSVRVQGLGLIVGFSVVYNNDNQVNRMRFACMRILSCMLACRKCNVIPEI